MKKQMLAGFLVLLLVFAPGAKGQESGAMQSRNNFAKIAFAGIGGAVLGLSTLPFYGKPEDHLSNITLGFSLGLLAGVGYVAIAPNPSTKTLGLSFNTSF